MAITFIVSLEPSKPTTAASVAAASAVRQRMVGLSAPRRMNAISASPEAPAGSLPSNS
jgi:hypothetical protein